MLTRNEAQNLAEKALKLSTFPECRVTVDATETAFTRFANNGITTAALSLRHSVTITASRNGSTGTASTNDIDDASLAAAVKHAEELAAVAPPSSEDVPALGPQEYGQTRDFDEKTANARSPEMIPFVKTVIDAARAKNLVAAGLMERSRRVTAMVNKKGLFAFHEGSDAGLTSTIRMPDGSSSGWAGHPATRMFEIDAARVAATAIDKCLRWKGPRKIDPGNYTVVLEPTATGDLVRLMSNAFSARNAEEGRTFLSKRGGGTRLGEKMFPEFVTLRTDPFDPRMPASPWVGNGSPARPTTWIDKGVVSNLAYDGYWAMKSGKPVTPAPGNTIMEGGTESLDQLIASVKRGLLVTHFWYIRFVNQQTLQHTGLTRDGLFLIEDGKISAPVMNLRFNESPVRLLKNTRKLGPSQRIRGLEGAIMVAPALVADDFPFTSTSEAI